jgi:hypothetical protein
VHVYDVFTKCHEKNVRYQQVSCSEAANNYSFVRCLYPRESNVRINEADGSPCEKVGVDPHNLTSMYHVGHQGDIILYFGSQIFFVQI